MAPPPPQSWADAPPYHYHGTPLSKTASPGEAAGGGGGPDKARSSLWIGGLFPWMNEDYLYSCFTRVPELVSVVIIRCKQTGRSEGYGFLKFADRSTAEHVLQSYNGQRMPNTDREFRLNWGTQQQDPPQRHAADDTSFHAVYVGDLTSDVTPFMLQHLFKSRYPSVRTAKVIQDKETGHSKGYGFVVFGDANEHRQAMTEMNGVYCSTRPMRIRPVLDKKTHRPYGTQGTDFHQQDPNTSRLFIGSLGQSVTSEDLKQAFTPYGELVDVMVLDGKRCGFVTYSNRASAEEALRMLNESELGGSTIRASYARPLANKQDQLSVGYHGRPQCYGPGCSPQGPYSCAQTGHPGNGSFHQQQPQVQ